MIKVDRTTAARSIKKLERNGFIESLGERNLNEMFKDSTLEAESLNKGDHSLHVLTKWLKMLERS